MLTTYRNFALTTALSLAMIGMAGTGAVQAQAQQGKKIAYFQNGPNNPYTSRMMNAFVDQAKTHGMETTVFPTNFDPALQAQQIDDAIAQKFDLLALMPVGAETVIPPLIRAKAAGIPVIIVNTEMKPGSEELYMSFVGERSVEMGELAGKAMAEVLKASGRKTAKIVLLTGPLTENVVAQRVDAIKAALAATPEYQIVAMEDVKWDMANAERVAGQHYARFAPEGGIDLIYGMADNVAIGAIRAAEASGQSLGTGPEQLIVMGGACQPPGIEMLKSGKSYATGIQIPQRTGRVAADLANDHFNGKTLEHDYVQEVATVTLDNLPEWEERCSWK